MKVQKITRYLRRNWVREKSSWEVRTRRLQTSKPHGCKWVGMFIWSKLLLVLAKDSHYINWRDKTTFPLHKSTKNLKKKKKSLPIKASRKIILIIPQKKTSNKITKKENTHNLPAQPLRLKTYICRTALK